MTRIRKILELLEGIDERTEHMSTEINNLKVKVDGLKTVVDTQKTAIESLVTLTASLKSQLDTLLAGGSLSPADAATVQGMSDTIDSTVTEITATAKEATDAIAADTPPAPTP